MAFLCAIVTLFVLAVVARAVLSWFPIGRGSPLLAVSDALATVTEPVLSPVRRMLPSFGGFDLSPVVVIIVAQIAARALFGC